MQVHDLGNFPECQLFLVIQAQNGTFNLGHPLDSFGEQALQFRLFDQIGGPVLFLVRNKAQQVTIVLIAATGFQAAQVDAANLNQPVVVFLNRDLQLQCNLVLSRCPFQHLLGG